MRRTKQVQVMVDSVNEYLKRNKIKDQYNDVAMVMMHSLIQANCYGGFNWFRTNEQGMQVLSGGEEKAEYIQLY